MIDTAKCLYCGDTFLINMGVLYELSPGLDKAKLEAHNCRGDILKTHVFEVSGYQGAMILVDVDAVDKRLSIDINYQPKSANRYVNSSTIYQRLFQASGTVTDFLCYLPEQQALRLPDLISYLQSLGYIVTDVGPIAKGPEHG